ncbi:uncharacterized protein LOC132051124 [Lycium ferocissimum]|uniref:uncharacterized protein LOC132051124 n=1 Tax=Lycium ferocissimum TaxID=112874 RepID=UPI0028154350|nr:uncharacterized protein LOC132051124 [Lycium ferocissimum]
MPNSWKLCNNLAKEVGCYPKDILKMMNFPGLTKTQVASQLQKCRNNNWRALEERKSIRHPSDQVSSSGSQQKNSFRKFGQCLVFKQMFQSCNESNVTHIKSKVAQSFHFHMLIPIIFMLEESVQLSSSSIVLNFRFNPLPQHWQPIQ